MGVYNKLVRDNIPAIIEVTGRKPITKTLNNDEYFVELKKKCFEELEEFVNTNNPQDAIEELADLLELFNALAVYHGSSLEKLEEVRRTKSEVRGGFFEKIYLFKVMD